MRRPGARWWSANGKTARWRSVTVASDCAMKKSRCVRWPQLRRQPSRSSTDGGCRHRRRPATHGEKAIDKSSRKGGQHSEQRAVEMAERWKAWKSKGRISPLPTVPWKSRKEREIPTFPQLRRKQADGKVENQKQVSHFPTATNPLSPGSKPGPRAGFALRPAATASRRPRSQRVVVADREK